jgi:hypothetical protein
MTDREQEIQARCEAATPGPWFVVDGKSFGVQAKDKNIACCFRTENEQFIAHSREDVPYLLAETARLRAELDAMTAERDKLREQIDRAEHEFEALITRREQERDAAQRSATYERGAKEAFDIRWQVENAKYNKSIVHLQKARGQRDAIKAELNAALESMTAERDAAQRRASAVGWADCIVDVMTSSRRGIVEERFSTLAGYRKWREMDRRGPDIVVIPGILGLVACLTALPFVHTPMMLYIIAAPMGLASGAVFPSINSMIFLRCSRQRRGTASAAYFASIDIGFAVGGILYGAVAGILGYSAVYWAAAALAAVALALYLKVVAEKKPVSA